MTRASVADEPHARAAASPGHHERLATLLEALVAVHVAAQHRARFPRPHERVDEGLAYDGTAPGHRAVGERRVVDEREGGTARRVGIRSIEHPREPFDLLAPFARRQRAGVAIEEHELDRLEATRVPPLSL